MPQPLLLAVCCQWGCVVATFPIPLFPLSLTFSPVADPSLSPAGLWIGNLPKDAADIEIKPMFACYGPVHGIKVEALF